MTDKRSTFAQVIAEVKGRGSWYMIWLSVRCGLVSCKVQLVVRHHIRANDAAFTVSP